MSMHRRIALTAASICGALMVLVLLLFVPIMRHKRFQSPDGRFAVVLQTQPIYALIPTMPGGGGDLPARATLYEGRKSCGAVWLEMASLADDLQWQLDSKPRAAEIRLVGRWNLDACSLEQE
jgi:hypothetical protein